MLTPLVRSVRFQNERVARFQESVIREMTRLALQHNAVNLAQGFPDFPAPAAIKQAAQDAIAADFNQYSITWGAKVFRDAIARKHAHFYGQEIDPEREITVCCGATEGMIATLLALLNPGDEVIILEPFYENYWPDSQLSGAVCRHVRLHPPKWTLALDELRAAFNERTRAIILNTPNNPTGRVFSREEMLAIAELCRQFDVLAITDEIYEHIIFDGEAHTPMMSLPGMRERSILVNSLSKTYSVTGWRVGWVVAPPEFTSDIRKVHDFLTVGAAAPLQQAGTAALHFSDEYYAQLTKEYQQKRDLAAQILRHAGFQFVEPKGAYYIMTDISHFGAADDVSFCRHLVEDVGVAAVPGSSFFSNSADGAQWVRFCFAKKRETLEAAGERLAKLVRAA